ncbi:TadE family type IV pilus minor pilin [Streptomyces cavernicola]|uniref:TadE family type IV pilus minor pilin n=1 Tax=Streptomyces cavernicola TaxID=3043613 RepID=A0ABT6SML5_9ACTN|nr:TadE family type IV pilus minor pilin [Streptomyces sp. B-S-A6]MDI3409408.1 TadE family type IV pilus minor pilin [Streptomyces sp. B-S-A6]
MSRPEPRAHGAGKGRDGGYVTAEAATVIPTLVLVGVAMLWGLMAAVAQIQCVDAARAGARAAARQEPERAAVDAAKRAAPEGARVTVSREGDLVRVAVAAHAPGPRALTLELKAHAVALSEEAVGRSWPQG